MRRGEPDALQSALVQTSSSSSRQRSVALASMSGTLNGEQTAAYGIHRKRFTEFTARSALGAARRASADLTAFAALRRVSMAELALPDNFTSACRALPQPHAIEVLMNPRSGSTLLVTAFKRCGKSVAIPRYHAYTYRPCSIVSLRDPCERVVSQFVHIKESYGRGIMGENAGGDHGPCKEPELKAFAGDGNDGEHWNDKHRVNHTLYAPHCTNHWLHRVHTVEQFVEQLQMRWKSEIINLTPRDSAHRIRHMLVNLPQFWWIGKGSLIMCTPTLTRDLPRYAELLNCSSLATQLHDAQVEANWNHQAHINASHNAYPLAHRRPGWDTMSAETCRVVRTLYAKDAALWDANCAASSRRE